MNKTGPKLLVLVLLLASSIVCKAVQPEVSTVTPTLTQTQTSIPTSTPTKTLEPTFTQTPTATTKPTITSTPTIATIPIVGQIKHNPGGFVYLGDKRTMALGFNMSAGGAIGSLLYNGRELIDHNDYGRYIQLSLYDGNQHYGPSGNQPFGNWGWNPIQAGSKAFLGARVANYRTSPGEVYIKAYGKEWGQDDTDSDVIFETWAWDRVTYFEIIVRATHFGKDFHAATKQEFPAAYFAKSLTTTYGYSSDSPFTGDPIDLGQKKTRSTSCREILPTENWLAYGNKNGLGLILAVPTEPYLAEDWSVCLFGTDSDPVPYLAPIAVFDNPPKAVHDARFYLIPGPIAGGRAIVYDLIPHTNWTFNLNSTEGWYSDSASTSVEKGILTAQLSPNNTLNQNGLDIPGHSAPYVNISTRAGETETNLCLSFLTADDQQWDRTKSSCVLVAASPFQIYTFDFERNPIWIEGTITQLRLSTTIPATIEIDTIALASQRAPINSNPVTKH